MFLLLFLISPIFAIDWRNMPRATPAPIKNDRFFFHTRLTCLLTEKEHYHFSIIFADRCPTLTHFGLGRKTNEITKRRQGMFPRGEKNFTVGGALEYNTKYDSSDNACRRRSNNYKTYAFINHDCTSDGESVYNEALITEECNLGTEEACHVFVDIDLAGPVVRVRKVEHSP